MPFETAPGLEGKVYVPETRAIFPKKYACRECYSCQMCSDDRCNVCRRQRDCDCDRTCTLDTEN